MKGRRLHLFVWYFLKPLCRLFVTLKFNFRPRIHPIGGPCLVVSNHCTDYDPILLGVTVRDQCYFIASEHIFRGGLPFDNVLDWDRWQAERMLEWTRSAGADLLASDEGIVLDEVSDGRGLQRRGCGTLRVFADRFELAGEIFPFADVTGIGLSGPQSIELSCAGRHWFISCPRVCNLRKYVTFYRAACAPGEILAV